MEQAAGERRDERRQDERRRDERRVEWGEGTSGEWDAR